MCIWGKNLLCKKPRPKLKPSPMLEFRDPKYRKQQILLGDWHFHPECPHWPKADYVEKDLLLDHDELCFECTRHQLRRLFGRMV
jgi:hypothetical protein